MTSDTNLHNAPAVGPDTAWQADVRAGVRHVRDLASLPLSPAERAAAQAAAVKHKVRAPKAYLDLIDWNDPADPIRAQVIPSPQELEEVEG
ncbi:KamA family radical SAM protein, partial [Mesorhizobium sp. M7A.T.Ca.US.000.02.2.1]